MMSKPGSSSGSSCSSNPLRGRSATESRAAFERVLALDPENEEALVHLARIASIEGRRGETDSLVRPLLALSPDTEVLETRAFRAFALGDRFFLMIRRPP